MKNNKSASTKYFFFFLLSISIFLQSCTNIPDNKYHVEKEIQGRFSLSFVNYKQSTQGRFIWKIYKKDDFEIEEFYFMDPWGKTRGILTKNLSLKSQIWELLDPNRKPLEKVYIENWMKKNLRLSYSEFNSLKLSLNIVSRKIRGYNKTKNRNPLIKVVTDTNLGKVIMNILPEI